MIFASRAAIILTFAILVSNYSIIDTAPQYALFVVLGLVASGTVLLSGRLEMRWRGWVDAIPMIYLVTWVYGVLLGVLLGNDRTSIIRNFAALTLYSVYFFWRYLNVRVWSIMRTIAAAGLINTVVGLAAGVVALLAARTAAVAAGLSFEQGRLYYSLGLSVSFASLGAATARLIAARDKMNGQDFKTMFLDSPLIAAATFVAILVASTVLSLSKGYTIGAIAVVGCVGLMSLRQALHTRPRRAIFGFLGMLIFIELLHALGALTVATNAFSALDFGNRLRYEQTERLMQELTLWGNGLGARLQSGYVRDPMGYGFEVSYVNLLHKFGVVALVMLVGYALTLILAVRLALRGRVARGAAALGSMGYLLPSIGNPSLISPTTVVLHCAALYIIAEPAVTLGGPVELASDGVPDQIVRAPTENVWVT